MDQAPTPDLLTRMLASPFWRSFIAIALALFVLKVFGEAGYDFVRGWNAGFNGPR
jgi:hypothetical protein